MRSSRRHFKPVPHANEKIPYLLKIMSHDIRGPLVSISATLKLLIRGYYGKMGEGVSNSLKDLLSKTTGLIGTTDEYLGKDASFDEDLENTGKALNLMRDVITPIFTELSQELKGHRVLVDDRFDALSNGQVTIKGSRAWLKAVFRNLLKNAIKYGDKDCTITIGFEDRGSSFRLNVYNSGKPIPAKWRSRLFSKFVRIKKKDCEPGGADGAGLGLYLIKNIIKKQGGDIWYEAKEDGSDFVFTLPRG